MKNDFELKMNEKISRKRGTINVCVLYARVYTEQYPEADDKKRGFAYQDAKSQIWIE